LPSDFEILQTGKAIQSSSKATLVVNVDKQTKNKISNQNVSKTRREVLAQVRNQSKSNKEAIKNQINKIFYFSLLMVYFSKFTLFQDFILFYVCSIMLLKCTMKSEQ
jgi:hypothetical protein